MRQVSNVARTVMCCFLKSGVLQLTLLLFTMPMSSVRVHVTVLGGSGQLVVGFIQNTNKSFAFNVMVAMIAL